MSKKFLMAFDFDHTVVDANSDMEIQLRYQTIPVPEYLRVMGVQHGDVCYLHETFRFHYTTDVTKSDFHHTLNQLPLVHGLYDCITELHKLGGEIIVISDANYYFIQHVLKHHNLLKHISKIFSNPSGFDAKGQLIIRPYMSNLKCTFSSRNLCKGKVLKDYVKMRKLEGQKFLFVGFAGDGINDFCPMRTLRKTDIAFPRADFSIADFITKQGKDGLYLHSNVDFWRSGHDIINGVVAKLNHINRNRGRGKVQ